MTDTPARPFWADAQLAKMPKRWEAQSVATWRTMAATSRGGADSWLRRRLEEIKEASRAGLWPGMDDQAICNMADAEARDYANKLASIEGHYRRTWAHMPDAMMARCITYRQVCKAVEMMDAHGLGDMWPDGPNMTDAGRLARLKAPEFWRRAYRKAHARTLEQCAIALGLVRADGDCYISRESRSLYAARQAANTAMLANTVAVNEHGDEKTLLELAEKSISNPTIRRGELMTRVSGFEGCADAMQHIKRWAVITCPSRMHKWTKLDNGKTVPNKRYDGTQPREAQQYLAQQWRRLCSWWERQGLRIYGFRTTEPHHDGCPHWNLLAFFAPMTEAVKGKRKTKGPTEAVPVFDDGLKRYFLSNESPEEAGAALHRVRVQAIDPNKGSAAAYIAKYISKGIDGKGMDVDLFGNPIEEAAPAVVAWARVWGIRQFQQIGGAPVTVWRELRRLHPDQAEAGPIPDKLAQALGAVNLANIEPGEKKAVAWMRYTNAQGGPTCKRAKQPVRLLRRDREGVNRYGEPKQAHVVGVMGAGRIPAQPPAHMRHMPGVEAMGWTRAAFLTVESERAAWVVVPKRDVLDAFEAQCELMAGRIAAHDAHQARAMEIRIQQARSRAEVVSVLGEARRPWTRVNNCTELSFTPTLDRIDRRGPVDEFAPYRAHRPKVGRFYDWKTKAGGPSKGTHGTAAQAA